MYFYEYSSFNMKNIAYFVTIKLTMKTNHISMYDHNYFQGSTCILIIV